MVRIAPHAETPAERVALAMGIVPLPAVEALFGPAIGRALHVAGRTGVTARLARDPGTAAELAAELGLQEEGTRHLLECLGALGYASPKGERWRLTRRGRKWLDSRSPHSVAGYVDHTHDYWEWWLGLEDVVRTGRGVRIHGAEPGDPSWRAYVRGQYELARLSAPEVARALRLPERPSALIDVAGAHGWFAAELCRRHPTLSATVVDLPGSAAVGREIIAEAGMSHRVAHVDGDLRTSDLGGPYDAALAFNIIHHLHPDDVLSLLRRLHAALRPDATLAVLDLFARPPDRRPDSSAFLGLFFYMTSEAAVHPPGALREWLLEAGFTEPREVPIRRIPAQTLYESRTLP
jgi:hypothetical protein